jgi:7-carboxy-7-deazaguanine synthase
MEAFYTIQGEGFNTGQAAYFIRLGGCDVGCVWCDVKESWDASRHVLRSVEEIADEAARFPAMRVVITGGEPLMYNLESLCSALRARGITTWIETSGAYPLSGTWDWICVSPKKFKSPLSEVLREAHELKVVVFNKSDFEWAAQHARAVSPACRLYLQPEWSRHEKVLPSVIDYVKADPRWQVSLQTHKFMNIP